MTVGRLGALGGLLLQEERRERRGEGVGWERRKMQGKISSETHALLISKSQNIPPCIPPPPFTSPPLFTQHLSTDTKTLNRVVCTCTVLPGNPRWQSGRHAGRSRWDNRNTTRAGITSVSCLGARRHRWYPESWRRIEGRWRTRGRPPHCWGSTRRGHCCRSRTGGWRRTETQEC